MSNRESGSADHSAGTSHDVPDDHRETLREAYRTEMEGKKPPAEVRADLKEVHLHHLVRETTSRHTETEQANEMVAIQKQAEVPDIYCFTCSEWIGVSGVDLTGTPRSRKDAYYLGGPPEGVIEAQDAVRDTLADLCVLAASKVPRVNDTSDALDFIEGEVEQARKRIEEADNGE